MAPHMLISFDLDDTLICYGESVPREPNPVPWPLRYWRREPVRAGTRQLLRTLTAEGWRIAVYTTSFRSPRSIARLLRAYGARPEVIVNQSLHRAAVERAGLRCAPTKLPSLFGIHLHVDDSEGVAEEGRRHGFPVVLVRPDDAQWTKTVLDAARAMRATPAAGDGMAKSLGRRSPCAP